MAGEIKLWQRGNSSGLPNGERLIETALIKVPLNDA
jgi:hypothetical protein